MRYAAKVIKDNRSRILDDWESRVKEEIPAAVISSDLVLRNQLSNVLEDITHIMNRYDGYLEVNEKDEYQEIIKDSLDHGRHRATASHLTVKQILKEYLIFHRILTGLLIDKQVYTKEVGNILKYALETAMLTSASAYNDSLQEMREKLIGTLAHDIRNPISAAYFALDVIKPEDDIERIENLKKMGLRSLKKSLDLVEGLLDAISVKAGEGLTLNFIETDVVKEVRWVYMEAKEIYTHSFNFHCSEENIIGIFDPTAIRRVIENLVTNAVKHGSRNTPINISIEAEGEYAVIKVKNWGKPIAKEDQLEIFNFLKKGVNRQEFNGDGWGMGLTLIKSVAEAHGGEVVLESNLDHGTAFYVRIKRYAQKPGKVRTELKYSEN
ncbi:HAMP domain-containing histidine kinase [Gramella lutea]|uniref:histidine kinase n=1 Tax=Christiangramia lutea TaxID=1607951 RepID=A0A9X2A9U3_9FLAO|nr:HAMP domain-containing sensor histidine kinase [Christiangramia lutea]MCH4823690.1 HAMP domain-containing histidine kinase [Christiangramia lutea]